MAETRLIFFFVLVNHALMQRYRNNMFCVYYVFLLIQFNKVF